MGAVPRSRVRRFRAVLVALVATLASREVARGGPSLGGPGRETVSIDTADGLKIAGVYSVPAGTSSGAPAVVLIHGEGQTRAAWAPLVESLEEHRVPWLAIDLRGHGESREQDGRDLSAKAKALDPEFCKGYAEDVYGAVRWLVDVKKHDPRRVGLFAADMSCAAAMNVCHLHKGEIAAFAMATPSTEQPGFMMAVDERDIDGNMDVLVLSSVEDANRYDDARKGQVKIGPRRVLYMIEHDRNAPPDTLREERILKRRGIPPRARFFAETGIFGTKMIAGVAHLDAWLAAWWARRFGTYPHAVLFDGSVDQKNDYADPGWSGATVVHGAGEQTATALRWGQRMMVGGEFPPDTKTIYLRIYATRGGGPQTAGQFAQIAYPAGTVSAQALFKSFMGRAPPTETAALVLEPEEIPQDDGTIRYGKPSFEAEVRLPMLDGDGPYEVRLSYAVGGGGGPENAPGVDPDKPETWTVIPDLFGDGAAATGATPAPNPGEEPKTPDGPVGPKAPPGKTPPSAPPKKPR